MALGSMIMKIRPEAEHGLRARLEQMPGVSVEEKSPQGDLILLVEAENLGALHKLSQEIEKAEGVLGLYPSYVTTEDEDE